MQRRLTENIPTRDTIVTISIDYSTNKLNRNAVELQELRAGIYFERSTASRTRKGRREGTLSFLYFYFNWSNHASSVQNPRSASPDHNPDR